MQAADSPTRYVAGSSVVDAPLLDEHLCFSRCVEDFFVEQFVAQLAVEGFAVAILLDKAHMKPDNERW